MERYISFFEKFFLEMVDSEKNNFLHLALLEEDVNLELVKFLVEKGICVNSQTSEGYTPLHYAKRKDVIEYLIESGANLDIGTHYYNETPLHNASLSGDINKVRILVTKGANINLKTSKGRTSLDYALMNNHDDVVEFLKENGATYTPKTFDEKYSTPMFYI